MSDTQHPTTPPAELVQAIWDRMCFSHLPPPESWAAALTEAAQWGADRELEACKALAEDKGVSWLAGSLQRERRPKPPSLKEQALQAHERCAFAKPGDRDTIRRALEQLDD